MHDAARLLLISNSTGYGTGYLDHAEGEIRSLIGEPRARVAFVPFAARDWGEYARRARARMERMGYSLRSVHDYSNRRRVVEECDAIFVGGGNTFRLLDGLQSSGLAATVAGCVQEGKAYVGSSAGAIVAGPSIRTTKDMPVVQPASFTALGLVGFHISPHYLDPDPRSTHMGETQEERILQFLEENEGVVIGLREGSMLRVEKGSVRIRGPRPARIFRKESPPVEQEPGADLAPWLAAEQLSGAA